MKQKKLPEDLKSSRRRFTVREDDREISLKRCRREKKERTPLTLSQKIALFFLLSGIGVYFGFSGTWSFIRLFQSLIDLLFSLGKYLLTLLFINADFVPGKVTEIPDVPFVPLLPLDPSELSGFFSRFFATFFSAEFFGTFNHDLTQKMQIVQRLILPVLILILVFSLSSDDFQSRANDDFGKKSKGVKRMEKVLSFFLPVRLWISSFLAAIPFWSVFLLALISLAGTNLLTVAVEFLAAVFYFSVSSDFYLLYSQVYKLALDLTIAWGTLPPAVWILVIYFVYSYYRRESAFSRLEAMEDKNRGFVSTLPLQVLITGKVGAGKTQTTTNLSLTVQDLHRERMRETMFKIQAEFPEYPWELLDQQIGVMYFCGDLRSKSSTRQIFDSYVKENDDLLFGYTRSMVFSDGVTVSHLRDRIVDYAELQYMYRVQCLISSSFSIRVDSKLTDSGKFPLWTSDYFRSEPYDPHGKSERCHILDFDTLRLGKTVSDNAPSGAWEFGIICHTEMGKDFGNAVTNKDLKANSKTANIKNDLLIDRLKIMRHSSTACFFPYAQYIGDEQRPTTLGADVLELCDVLRIIGSSPDKTTYHLLTIERFVCDLILHLWQSRYCQRRVYCADEDLPTWILRKLMKRIYPWYQEKLQRFGYQEITAKVFDGTNVEEKDAPEAKIYSCFKKVYAGRYGTDCFSHVLASRSERSSWDFDGSSVYAGMVATSEEIEKQRSYFGNKLLKIEKESDDEDLGSN